MAKTSAMMRLVCMGKHKASEQLVDGLGRGEFADSKDLKCYANCVLEMMQAMKKGKVTADSAIKQIELLIPSEIAEPTVGAFRLCRDAGKQMFGQDALWQQFNRSSLRFVFHPLANGIKNPCEAAYALLKCIHANNPKYFFA
ncbi:Odorant-binding protein 56e, putative [Anopheles sinensis]|uniref:Odorant-binding protein 56e, putative n=1 Tax=Anopheles sinensis TaxID=74873 RepID=A0A084WPA0_ANOSI|nr:Odorant-binding protein 56e, putative [Anopheles sinensis]